VGILLKHGQPLTLNCPLKLPRTCNRTYQYQTLYVYHKTPFCKWVNHTLIAVVPDCHVLCEEMLKSTSASTVFSVRCQRRLKKQLSIERIIQHSIITTTWLHTDGWNWRAVCCKSEKRPMKEAVKCSLNIIAYAGSVTCVCIDVCVCV